MNSKRIYTFLLIAGALLVLIGIIDYLKGDGFNAIPFISGFIMIAAGNIALKLTSKKNVMK